MQRLASPLLSLPVAAVLLAATTGAAQAPLDTAAIHRITGVAGTASGAEYRVSVAQNDLDARLDGFRIVPPMGLGSWAAFTPAPGGAMLMGDVVVLPVEVGAVQRTAMAHGLAVTGLHNHFAGEEPHVMFMHIHGMGPTESLAGGVRAVLDTVAARRGANPAAARRRWLRARWTRRGSRPCSDTPASSRAASTA